jgi:hypothetical protein
MIAKRASAHITAAALTQPRLAHQLLVTRAAPQIRPMANPSSNPTVAQVPEAAGVASQAPPEPEVAAAASAAAAGLGAAAPSHSLAHLVDEVLAANEQLLESIALGNWERYAVSSSFSRWLRLALAWSKGSRS